MSLEKDLVLYLAAQGALALTAGTNLFEGPMPESPDVCVGVTHYASQATDDFTMGASLSLPGSELVRAQVCVRSARTTVSGAKDAAVTLANAIHRFLENGQGITPAGTGASGKLIFAIVSEGPPYDIGRDKNERWRWVANYEIRRQPE